MKKLSFALLLLFFSLSVSAQRGRPGSIFTPGWYVGLNMGQNLFIAEGYKDYLVNDPLSAIAWTGRAEVGYTFTGVFGLRSLMGYSTYNWPGNPSIAFDAENFTLDFTANLSNINSVYNLRRPVDFVVFAGTGLAHRRATSALPENNTSYIIRLGFQFDFHISQSFELNLIAENNFLDDKFNNFTPDDQNFPFDMDMVLGVGLTYHIYTPHRIRFGE